MLIKSCIQVLLQSFLFIPNIEYKPLSILVIMIIVEYVHTAPTENKYYIDDLLLVLVNITLYNYFKLAFKFSQVPHSSSFKLGNIFGHSLMYSNLLYECEPETRSAAY
jgi:hypothetical protein